MAPHNTTEYRTQTCFSIFHLDIPYPPPFPVTKYSLTAPCGPSIKPHLTLLICLPLLVRHLSRSWSCVQRNSLCWVYSDYLTRAILLQVPDVLRTTYRLAETIVNAAHQAALLRSTASECVSSRLGCQLWRLRSPARYEESQSKRIHQNAVLLKYHTPVEVV